jgi:hypothetical protein
MSTRNPPEGKRRPARKAENLTDRGSLDVSADYRPLWAVNGDRFKCLDKVVIGGDTEIATWTARIAYCFRHNRWLHVGSCELGSRFLRP